MTSHAPSPDLNTRRSSRGRPLAVGLGAFTALLAAALWLHLPLLNGPQEWQWEYHPPQLAPLGGALALLSALALIALVASSWTGRGAIGALVVVGMGLCLGVVTAQPGATGRVMEALSSRNTFGFVWDAGLAPETAALLANYPAASAALNQHSATHPPGPLLIVRGLNVLVRAVTDGDSLAGLRADAARALGRERERAHAHGRPLPKRLPEPATLVLLAFLLPLCGCLTAFPLAALGAALGLDRQTTRIAAALWLVVPALSLFTPSFDQALPLLLVSAAWLACRRGWAAAVLTGALLWCAGFVSYGALPFVPLVLLLAAAARTAAEPVNPGEERPTGVARVLVVLLTMGVAWGALWISTGFAPWAALRGALDLHRHIAVEPRTYSTWLIGDGWDFALLLGPPILGLAILRPAATSQKARAISLLWFGFWGILLLQWLSGSVRGEVGRIWLPWMPFACVLAAAGWEGAARRSTVVVLTGQVLLLGALAANLTFIG